MWALLLFFLSCFFLPFFHNIQDISHLFFLYTTWFFQMLWLTTLLTWHCSTFNCAQCLFIFHIFPFFPQFMSCFLFVSTEQTAKNNDNTPTQAGIVNPTLPFKCALCLCTKTRVSWVTFPTHTHHSSSSLFSHYQHPPLLSVNKKQINETIL